MAFCRFCSKELQEGEVCSCQAGAQAAPEQTAPVPPVQPETAQVPPVQATDTPVQPVPPVQPGTTQVPPVQPGTPQAGGTPQTSVTITLPNKNEVTDGLKQILSTILGVLKKPATESAAFVNKPNKITAIGIMIVQALFSCLFAMIVLGRFNSEGAEFSMVNAFFVTLLFSVIFSVIMTALLWGSLLILKVNAGLDRALALAAVRSIGLLPMIIVGTVCFIINTDKTMTLGMLLYFASFILGAIFLLGAFKAATGKEDISVYAVFVVMLIFVWLFWLIGMKLAFPLYFPKEVREYMDFGTSILRMMF